MAAEIVVFSLIGPWLLRRIQPTTAMAIAALAAALRWCVMSQTSSISVLALIQPLHGITFALLHLACTRIIVLVTPTAMAASAQAIYALGIGATSAVLTLLSGYLYGRLGLTGFFIMAMLSLAALPVFGFFLVRCRIGKVFTFQKKWMTRRRTRSRSTPFPSLRGVCSRAQMVLASAEEHCRHHSVETEDD